LRKERKKEIIKKGNFLNFVKKGNWEYIERNNCSGIVVILAVTKEKKVLFVEQYRPPLGKNVIEFPSGLAGDHKKFWNSDKKESLLQAAKRELLEETGYQAKGMRKIVEGPANSGTSSDMLTFLKAVSIEKVASGGGDETESILVHEIFIHDIERWIKKKKKEGCLIIPRIYTGLYFLNRDFAVELFSGAKK